MSIVDRQLIAALEGITGAGALRDGERLAALNPGFHDDNLKAGLLVQPATTGEVAAIVRFAAEHGLALVPQGGRTGLAGAATSRPGELVVDMNRMNAIVEVDPDNAIAVAEAGVTLAALQQACAPHGFTPGIDLAARDTATIGGLVSTNAGGLDAFRHGMMRQRVLGLEAVLPDGTVLDDLARVTKVNEGYDIKQLLIGAEGTLGIVTRVAIRLAPAPGPRATALIALPTASDAVRLFHRLNAMTGAPLLLAEIMFRRYAKDSAFELGLSHVLDFEDSPVYVIIDWQGETADAAAEALGEALLPGFEDGSITNAVLAKNEAERGEIWRIREDSWSIGRLYPHGLWYDVSVPLDRLDSYVAGLETRIAAIEPALMIHAMGHLGDGNLHLTIAHTAPVGEFYQPVTDAVNEGLKAMGGAISAEHGIGIEKLESLTRHGDPAKLAAMRAIKHALDPKNIMNPGKVVPPAR